MPGNIFRRIYAWGKDCKYQSLILIVLVGSCVLAAALFVMDRRKAMEPVSSIQRARSGQGSITKEMQLVLNGVRQKGTISITVQERNYTEEELQKVFREENDKLEERILGENESLDQVQHDLNLIRDIPGQPIRVEWEVSRYDVMSVYGVLNEDKLQQKPEGILVNLKACLVYRHDESKRAVTEMSAKLYPLSVGKDAGKIAYISEELRKQEESSREENAFEIPKQIDGEKIELHDSQDQRGWYVLALGPVIGILLIALDRQNRQKELQEKHRQMMLDYPEITDKLTLLLGAGITVKSAWQKIVSDYEKQKEHYGIRFAYEEMGKTCHEMQSGVTEMAAYEQFGKRCGLKSYRKLAALLTQNLRKGSKGLSELLRAEAEQAFEERKASAKKRGEEAGTKLLLPMFMMLSMVLLVVIVPAFLSIQM